MGMMNFGMSILNDNIEGLAGIHGECDWEWIFWMINWMINT